MLLVNSRGCKPRRRSPFLSLSLFRSILKMSSMGALAELPLAASPFAVLLRSSVTKKCCYVLVLVVLIFAQQLQSSQAVVVRRERQRQHRREQGAGVPQTRVVEITETETTKLQVSRVQKVVNKKPNSDIIVGEDVGAESKIVFECNAPYPVQWVYNGDGMPEYSTNTSVIRDEYSTRRSKFTASASLGFQRQLGPQDSGKYTCRSLQDQDVSSYYYLFAGDKFLFTNRGGETIPFKRSDETVRIPCSVSNPKAVVTLQKSLDGLVQCPLNESISFEPTKGFLLKLSHFHDAAGVYVCTAGYNDTFQVAKYTLESSEPQRLTCSHNAVCSSSEACLGGICRSPCENYCAQYADCKAIRHTPVCSCPQGFRGDGYRTCYRYQEPTTRPPPPEEITDPCEPNPCGPHANCNSNNRFISCACKPGYVGQPPRCRPECLYEGDCPYDRSCVSFRCVNPCDGACGNYPSRECRVINREPVCSLCPPGFAGKACQSLKTEGAVQHPRPRPSAPKQPPPKEVTSSSSEKFNLKKVCKPNPCGLNALCEAELTYNEVYNTTAEVALCKCKPSHYGDAYEECFPPTHFASDSLESDSHSLEYLEVVTAQPVHITAPTEDSSPPPPSSSGEGSCKCGKGAVCDAESGECTCPSYLEGNPYIECRRRYCVKPEDCANVFENPVCTFNECHEALKVTIAKRCGAHAISTIVAGKVACSCPEGYTGIATIECHPRLLVRTNESEHSNQECSPNPCGQNAICTNKNGVAVCECMVPFQGNPLVGCELKCSNDNDCPLSHTCSEKGETCVDPCDKNHQHFFTECGQKANCKVEDHTPVCYCPIEYPFGSPNIHCKEKSWMKDNPLVTHTACDNQAANCGENSECHGNRCYCLPGFYGDPVGKPGCQRGIECNVNNQCPPTMECLNGKCLDPCRRKRVSCSANSGCRAENHQAVCTCKIGTIRNPSGQCEYVTGALAERFSFFRAFEDVE